MFALSNFDFARRLVLYALFASCALYSASSLVVFAQPPLSDLDRELLDDLKQPSPETSRDDDPGEDVGGEGPANSRGNSRAGSRAGDALASELGRLSAEMREIGEQLRTEGASPGMPAPPATLNEARSRQDRLTEDLAKLIADLQRQSPGNAGASASSSAAAAAATQSSSPAAAQASPKPAGTDDETAGKDDEAAGEGAASLSPPDLKANVWGHLPQRWRSQMATGAAVEFLPRYRDAIEDYYRRLAKTNSPE